MEVSREFLETKRMRDRKTYPSVLEFLTKYTILSVGSFRVAIRPSIKTKIVSRVSRGSRIYGVILNSAYM